MTDIISEDSANTSMTLLDRIKKAPEDQKESTLIEGLMIYCPEDQIPNIRKYLVDHRYMTAKKFEDTVKSVIRKHEINDTLGFNPTSLSQFIEEAFKTTLRYEQNLGGGIDVIPGPLPELTGDKEVDRYLQSEQEIMRTRNIAFADVMNDLIVLNADLNLGYSSVSIRAGLEKYLKNDRQTKKTKVMLGLSYRGSKIERRQADAHWKNFEDSAFVGHDYKEGFITAVFKKFIWQVKRKTRGLPVTDHLVPIIYGEQGAGKSVMITTFLKPLGGCFKDISVDLLTDGKTNDIYDYPVLFLEELSKVHDASPETLKQVLTGSTVNNRNFHSQTTANIKQLSTFIAATNKRTQTMIRDETGMRRYVELTMYGPTNREVLNAVNFEALWCSVDEEAADPMIPFVDILKEIQESMRTKSSVEEFLEDDFKPTHFEREDIKNNEGYIKTPILYRHYEDWCSRYGHKAMNKGNFIEKARTLIQFNHTLKTSWKVKKTGNSFHFKHIKENLS